MDKCFRTNTIIAEFNLCEIENDFIAVRFETSEKYIQYGASFLDGIGDSNARAVAFEGGRLFYALYSKKDYKANALSSFFAASENYKFLSYSVVSIMTIGPNILLQLLINTLNNPTADGLAFNNLAGKLFVTDSALFVRKKDEYKQDYISQIPSLEIKIDAEMNLLFDVATFTSLKERQYLKFEKKMLYEYPKYDFTINNTLKRTYDSNGFIRKQFSNKKTNIAFLDFKDYGRFKVSKCGLLNAFFQAVKKRLKNYLSICCATINEFSEIMVLDYDSKYNKRLMIQRLNNQGVNIVNKALGDYTEDFAHEFVNALKTAGIINISSTNEPDKSKTNIRIVNNKDFYERYKIDDPYTKREMIGVQHITYEDFSCDSEAAVRCVLKEIAIKDDLTAGAIRMFDWSTLGLTSPAIFGQKKDEKYCFMTVQNDGKFEFACYENNWECELAAQIAVLGSLYAKYKTSIEGVIFVGDEVYAIKNTELKAMPDFIYIAEMLYNENLPLDIKKGKMLEYLKLLMAESNNKKEITILPEFESHVKNNDKTNYCRKEILDLIQSTKLRKQLNKLIYNDTGLILKNYLRQAAYRELLFGSNLHIKSFEKNGRYFYFVGEIGDNIQTGFNCASNIREIEIVKGDGKMSGTITALLNTDFVRNEQLTVLPFPFKYLSEYIKMRESCNEC